MLNGIKIIIIYSLRIVLRVFYIFPINERRIIFISYEGRQYSCNPKYIFEYMQKLYGDTYQYVWCLNDKKMLPDKYKNIKCVKFISLNYIYYAMVSKYVISNLHIEPFLPIRKSQIVVNTWHGGGAYKRVSAFLNIYLSRRRYMLILRDIRVKHTNYIISSCKKFTEYLSEDWNISYKKFLSIGMPRNDIFFIDTEELKKDIKKYYNINNNLNIILYAPTFRGMFRRPEGFDFTLQSERIFKAANKRFNKQFALFYRGHQAFHFCNMPDNIVNVTDYPDMQKLLCAADVLITDYSSSIWDFSLTYKPCFIYAPDLKKYLADQEFYTPIAEWPFMVAETNEQLAENILNFNTEKYKARINQHHRDLGSYEMGTAAKQFCELVL
jgi:CDP-glycerol glycerophosphotransferase